MWLVFFLVIACCEALSSTQAPNTLRQVHVVHRHGVRNPQAQFDSDPNDWSQGLGQLRPEGMTQMYDLGRFLRHRYTGFLSEAYVPTEVYMRSTDFDRTLMSAECNLAGLYKPNGEQIWNADIQWQPVPVHTVAQSKEILLAQGLGEACPKFHQMLLQAVSESTELKENEELLREIKIKARWDDKPMYAVFDDISDIIYVEAFLNRSMAPWITPEISEKMLDMRVMAMEIGNKLPLMTKLRAGMFLRELLDHHSVKAEKGTGQSHLMYIYSAHDNTLAAILYALQCWNGVMVPYAAALIFELHQQPTGQYVVRTFYKNDTVFALWHEPYPLQLPGCSVDCPLQQFRELVAPMVIENAEEYYALCEVDLATSSSGGFTVSKVLLSFLALVVVKGTD